MVRRKRQRCQQSWFLLGYSIYPNLRKWQKSWAMSTLGWFISTTVYFQAWYFYWNMSALLLWQIEPNMLFPKFPKKGSEVSTKEEGAKHSKINLGIRSPTVCYLMIVTVNIKSHQYQPSHPNHCQCLHHQLIAGSDDNDGEENREATAEVFYKSSWLAEASKQVNMILIKEGLWKCCHRFRPRIHQYHQDSCALSGIITPKDPDPNFQRQT